ncbi:MAG: polysaccharide biosynthesis tyrosine autokinase [Chloroflexi bacterium]|nr:polysaccharide biosynthesis tyrosine autokinase [Chloroflexota bacterium]
MSPTTTETGLRFVQRWWPLLLIGPLVGLLAGILVLQRVRPVYEATVTVLVGQGGGAVAGSTDVSGAEELARTYAEAIHARPVLEAAVRQVGNAMTADELGQAVSAKPVTNTQLLRISVDDTDPVRAADLANSVVAVFAANNAQAQQSVFATTQQNLEQLLATQGQAINDHTAEIQQLQAQAPAPQRDADLNRLQSELGQLQVVYSNTSRTYEDLRLTEARGFSTVSVVDPAVAPTAPSRPNRPLTLGMSLLAGLAIAIAVGLLANYLDDRLPSRQRVADGTGLPVLGEVPRWSLAAQGTTTVAQLLRGEANDPETRRAAEGYRLLLNNLIVAAGTARPRSLMIASAIAGEGKSTTAANLAVVQAGAGKRVILLDANLYRPAVTRLFNIPNRAGLSTLLANASESVDDVLRATQLDELKIVTSGPAPTDPSALLSLDRLEERLAEVTDHCDLLVIDTPPLLAQPDAALLAARVDAVLLVTDARVSRRSQTLRAVEMLRQAGAVILGVALNRAPQQAVKYASEAYQGTTPPDAGPGADRTAPIATTPLTSRKA